MNKYYLPGVSILALALVPKLSQPSGVYQRAELPAQLPFPGPHVDPCSGGANSAACSHGAALLGDGSELTAGLVFNGGDGFVVHHGSAAGPSRFLCATREGRLLGWNPEVDPQHAIVALDNSARGAAYTGVALAENLCAEFLYVANFASGSIDVFDARFAPVQSFTDKEVPPHYAPFGIAELDGRIVVTFVPRDPTSGEAVAGAGHGLIDVFATTGKRISRLATGGELNAPWALARAPGSFGPFSHKLLVGNRGDGRILAFNHSGQFQGQLAGTDGEPLAIEGLRALRFGAGGNGGDVHHLYFTACGEGEAHGVFGEIEFAD